MQRLSFYFFNGLALLHFARICPLLRFFIIIYSLIILTTEHSFSQEANQPIESTVSPEVQITTSELKEQDTSRRTTNFEWTQVNEAKSYEIEITALKRDQNKSQIFTFTVTTPAWDGQLKPGKYSMRLRSRDHRNVPGDWSLPEVFNVKLYAPKPLRPKPLEEFKPEQEESYELTLQWENQPEASRYKVHLEDETKTFIKDLETTKNSINVQVPIARRYKWSVIGYDQQDHEGEPLVESLAFAVFGKKLNPPKITPPETHFIRSLTWEAIPEAKKYTYTLYQLEKPPGRKWIKFKEGNTNSPELNFETEWPGGKYRLSIEAQTDLHDSAKTVSQVFEVASGYRSIEAEQKALLTKSIQRVTNWYVAFGYIVNKIEYNSINWDVESKPSFKNLAGTAHLSLGYLSSQKPYGFLGNFDYSLITIQEKNYRFPSLEIQGLYRITSDIPTELYLKLGLYSKESPEIIGATVTENNISTLKVMGLQVGTEYWYPLNSLVSLQLNGQISYPLSGSTPGGGKIKSAPSSQVGFGGSLRLSKNTTGLLGYSYRKDQINYAVTNETSIANGSTINETQIEGHHLNFFLEWDL